MQTRRERQHAATCEEIKSIARQQMREQGTATISLHAIAREMGITTPALYRYFPTRDALVTALIIDAYEVQVAMIQAATHTQPQDAFILQLYEVILAYREWALRHSIDFILIAGNPIPGYTIPNDVLISARKGMDLVVALLAKALHAGQIIVPSIEQSPTLLEMLEELSLQRGYNIPLPLLHFAITGWSLVQGLVSLEISQSTAPLLNNPGEFYRCEAQNLLNRLGFHPDE
jgi:AcrR family transcriptional regulator